MVVRAARRERASLRPDLAGVRRAAHAGVALVVRTLTLRASLLVMTYGAAPSAPTSVAAHQLASTLWTFLAFALDAVAIAAQALTGRTLGAGELAETRAVTDRMVRWGLVSGVVTAVGLALTAPLLGRRCSPPTRRSATCWGRCCSRPRSSSRWPAWSSSSTAC